ncbi:MAG: tetratricopeptide repeat protein [Pirellulales bacterium]
MAGATFGKHASHLRSGIAAAQAENWPLAQGYFQRALAEKPKSHEALYNLGVSHEALGQYAEAARLYKLAGEKKNQAPYRMAARRAQRAEQEIILAMAKAQRAAMLAQQTHQHQPGPAPPKFGGQFSAGPPVASGRAAAYFHDRPVYVGRTGSGPIRRLPPVW